MFLVYITNRTEMFLVCALRKVDNCYCKEGWIQQPSRVKTSWPGPPSPASRAELSRPGPIFFSPKKHYHDFKRRVPFFGKYIFFGVIQSGIMVQRSTLIKTQPFIVSKYPQLYSSQLWVCKLYVDCRFSPSYYQSCTALGGDQYSSIHYLCTLYRLCLHRECYCFCQKLLYRIGVHTP